MGQTELFNHLLKIIIIISYLKPYSCVRAVFDRNTWYHLTVYKQIIYVKLNY